MGIGVASLCKINANIGEFCRHFNIDEELKKLHTAVHSGRYGDGSFTAGHSEIREAILRTRRFPSNSADLRGNHTREPSGRLERKNRAARVIEEQAEQGVDYMTIHAGGADPIFAVDFETNHRNVSRGGAILAQWDGPSSQTEFLYERFDDICKIFAKHDVSFSLATVCVLMHRPMPATKPVAELEDSGELRRSLGPTCRR